LSLKNDDAFELAKMASKFVKIVVVRDDNIWNVSSDPFFGRCIKNHDEFHSFDAQEIDVGVYFASVKWQLIVACLLSVGKL